MFQKRICGLFLLINRLCTNSKFLRAIISVCLGVVVLIQRSHFPSNTFVIESLYFSFIKYELEYYMLKSMASRA